MCKNIAQLQGRCFFLLFMLNWWVKLISFGSLIFMCFVDTNNQELTNSKKLINEYNAACSRLHSLCYHACFSKFCVCHSLLLLLSLLVVTTGIVVSLFLCPYHYNKIWAKDYSLYRRYVWFVSHFSLHLQQRSALSYSKSEGTPNRFNVGISTHHHQSSHSLGTSRSTLKTSTSNIYRADGYITKNVSMSTASTGPSAPHDYVPSYYKPQTKVTNLDGKQCVLFY